MISIKRLFAAAQALSLQGATIDRARLGSEALGPHTGTKTVATPDTRVAEEVKRRQIALITRYVWSVRTR